MYKSTRGMPQDLQGGYGITSILTRAQSLTSIQEFEKRVMWNTEITNRERGAMAILYDTLDLATLLLIVV